jgi:hypothetical protein
VILIAVAHLSTLRTTAQTSSPSPFVQAAVSNFLSRLTNDEARAAFRAKLAAEFPPPVLLPLHVFTGWITNGPAVCAGTRLATTNYNDNPYFVELNRLGYPTPPLERLVYYTNTTFDHYLAGSLNHVCWTNFISNTNGRTTQIWSVRSHPTGWPARPPLVTWNTNCLMWGMKGLTAVSPCWQGEAAPGWVPFTALTRRHGYAVGHGRGRNGFLNNMAGTKVWFLTKDNVPVEATVEREAVRTMGESGRDYTIVLFKKDLPDSIEPMRVISNETKLRKYPMVGNVPELLFMTEQTGNVSAGVAGFTVPTMKGGDSGSPNMIPMPGELVFCGGRTTSSPSQAMQADMDELSRLGGLDPAKYQLQWVDLSAFPSY